MIVNYDILTLVGAWRSPVLREMQNRAGSATGSRSLRAKRRAVKPVGRGFKSLRSH